jgi:hypothetical protein
VAQGTPDASGSEYEGFYRRAIRHVPRRPPGPWDAWIIPNNLDPSRTKPSPRPILNGGMLQRDVTSKRLCSLSAKWGQKR